MLLSNESSVWEMTCIHASSSVADSARNTTRRWDLNTSRLVTRSSSSNASSCTRVANSSLHWDRLMVSDGGVADALARRTHSARLPDNSAADAERSPTAPPAADPLRGGDDDGDTAGASAVVGVGPEWAGLASGLQMTRTVCQIQTQPAG